MLEQGVLKAIFLPESIQEKLKVRPDENVKIIIENNKVKLKNQLEAALDEISSLIENDFTEIGVVDYKSATDYMMNIRYGQES